MMRGYLDDLFADDAVVVTKQPTDMGRKTKLFQKMMCCAAHEDVDYRAVQLITMYERVQHRFEQIAPALEVGRTVICDRYIYTSLANMTARGYTKEKWFFQAAKKLIKPDQIFLSFTPLEVAIARIKASPEEYNRHLEESQFWKTSANFKEISNQYGFVVLDTTKSSEETFFVIRSKIDELFELEG